ncbi:GNAT family N-acetyltransferase [Sphingomonas aurantiaca]|jgi:GNAT superfamily N-acetyltransferase|uniref:Acetyltransferase (GNAT) family protein n=1 Tax=Sphingomonas aurantiaca TaxID=185949 RepID=A0A2T5GRP2_9SPHN|nr:GNAT family N-acetyltransferase [Sphingomonas aurantiaca]PTQ61965.1 acetyltransferase (GNAT) family protein [Sphingomonas aurantiaca]
MTIILSDDASRLQIDRIHGWLASSYWSPGIERALVERAIAGSHCLGAYRDDEQVAFARMITDHATFAWLADVWVEESVRGQGLGRRMVGWFLDHPLFAGLRRIGLVTADAHGVYAGLGFHPLVRADRYMERLAPGLADQLRTAP